MFGVFCRRNCFYLQHQILEHLKKSQTLSEAKDLLFVDTNCAFGRTDGRTGGPLKPAFGLSGAVRPLDKVFPPLVRVFVPSTLTRSPPVPRSRLRSGGNCSTPSPSDIHTILPSPDCDEY